METTAQNLRIQEANLESNAPEGPNFLGTDTRRIGIVGLADAGKTTFLASLIDRIWRERDRPRKGVLGFGTSTSRVRLRKLGERDPEQFPVAGYLENRLALQKWPRKTVAGTAFRFRYWQEEQNAVTQKLDNVLVKLPLGGGKVGSHLPVLAAKDWTFIDLPGERVTDFGMVGKSYEQWSDSFLSELEDGEYAEEAEPYLQLLRSSAPLNEADTLRSFKEMLARFTKAEVPKVTPSTFLVDHGGAYPKGVTPAREMSIEDLVNRGICGIDAARQFAPLNAAARVRCPALSRGFASLYEEYRQKIAEPLAGNFAGCEDLLVLVDLVKLLEEGRRSYRAARNALGSVLRCLKMGHDRWELIADFARKYLGGQGVDRLRRVAVIATKADCVHGQDRAHLATLVRTMTEDLIREAIGARSVEVRYFSCAAIRATVDEEYPKLKGQMRLNGSDPQWFSAEVSSLGPEWPKESEWPAGRYAFFDPCPPELDMIGSDPFPNIHVDEVLAFLGWKGA